MSEIETGEITLAEYEKLNDEYKASIRRELRLEAAVHDCCKLAEKLDSMLKKVGL